MDAGLPYNYDRSDAVANVHFSMQFGVATNREWRPFESGVHFA